MNFKTSAALKRVLKDENGNVAIEYGLIALIIAVGLVPALQLIAPALNNVFLTVTTFL